jgi:hypothetical protein
VGLAVAAMLILALAVRASIRPQVWLVIQAHEIVRVNVSLQNDVASVAAIAAVRPATRNKFFPAEAAAAVATIPSLRVNANVIDEFHSAIKPKNAKGRKSQASRPGRRRSLLA